MKIYSIASAVMAGSKANVTFKIAWNGQHCLADHIILYKLSGPPQRILQHGIAATMGWKRIKHSPMLRLTYIQVSYKPAGQLLVQRKDLLRKELCMYVLVETYVVIGVASYYFVLEKATFCHGKKGALALVT